MTVLNFRRIYSRKRVPSAYGPGMSGDQLSVTVMLMMLLSEICYDVSGLICRGC